MEILENLYENIFKNRIVKEIKSMTGDDLSGNGFLNEIYCFVEEYLGAESGDIGYDDADKQDEILLSIKNETNKDVLNSKVKELFDLIVEVVRCNVPTPAEFIIKYYDMHGNHYSNSDETFKDFVKAYQRFFEITSAYNSDGSDSCGCLELLMRTGLDKEDELIKCWENQYE